jgi:hypothetical protein
MNSEKKITKDDLISVITVIFINWHTFSRHEASYSLQIWFYKSTSQIQINVISYTQQKKQQILT